VAQELRELFALSAPTVATMISYTLMQFVDGLMVARITPADPVNLAAQGNGSIWAFVPTSFLVGMLGVVNTYVAQNLGAGKPERGAAYAWNAMWLAALGYLVVVAYALVLPSIFALDAAGRDPQMLAMQTQYAQILLFGALPMLITRGLSQFFYGLHRPKIVLVAALVGNATNLIGNWLLIYGSPKLGIPALGVQGAAIATVIGTFVECLFPLALFLSARYQREFHTRESWRPSGSHMREIVTIGWPASIMVGNELVCWAIFMDKLVGSFGKEHNMAGWITLRYMHLSFMPAVGLSYAMTSIVGKAIGQGRPDIARHKARLGIAVTAIYMGVCGVLFIVFRHQLVGLFVASDASPELAAQIQSIGTSLLIIAAIFQFADGIGIALLGCLRGAGDTLFPGVATIVLAWLLIVGLGWALAVGMPSWESKGPWIGAAAYIFALGAVLLYRWHSPAWEKIHLVDGPKSPEKVAPTNAA